MSDFSWYPAYPIEENVQFDTLVSTFENGAEQRRSKRANPKRSWQLSFINRNQTIWEAIRNFHIAKKGRLTSFTWTNPNDNIEYNVRFGEDKLTYTKNESDLYSFTITLEEIL